MTEHRVHPRFAIRLSAEVACGDRTFTGTTRNVSVGGCCLESAFPLAEGAEVRLDLFVVVDGIEDERMPPLTTRATVQWAAEQDDGAFAAGLRFTGLTAAQQRWLDQFLARTGAGDA
ncbi:MAG: PilZ domain-containing protein [Deltaproteobacteria bacterium]|nr:MAG: PilZ domain-containing protein [Deltaproteobacteria bacterium]